MKTYSNLYKQVCSKENLELAWKKARKRKTLKQYVIAFESNISENLALLRTELLLHSYRPLPLSTFVLRDPKTRKISVSNFRDRIVHHALCNIIGSIYDARFIHDSYANRKGKGTLNAIKQLDEFKRKVSHNGTIISKFRSRNVRGFFLKCDIKHYFDTVSHANLMEILRKTIKDREVLFLIHNILKNHSTQTKGRGMPLGNLTSQFFANIYLNELDQYVKHELKAKYYIRYVDDFIILHKDKNQLFYYKDNIAEFLKQKLLICLNLEKSKIKPLSRGIDFLGYRIHYYHKLLRKRNIRKVYRQLSQLKTEFDSGQIDYDRIYNFLEGWCAYAKNANTYSLRKQLLTQFENYFCGLISNKEIDRYLKDADKLVAPELVIIH